MPTSAPGSDRPGQGKEGRQPTAQQAVLGSGLRTGLGPRTQPRAEQPTAQSGFTLIELLIVLTIVALASALATLALRDPQASALEREADRLSALIEGARAEARASGLSLIWVPTGQTSAPADADDRPGFRFVGLPATAGLPQHWLTPGVEAEVIGARALVLGPEPIIGVQRVALRLADRRLTLVTDGIGPFLPDQADPDRAAGTTRGVTR
jgi:general secretion pathway protein H